MTRFFPKPDRDAWLMPYLVVADMKASMTFYERAFGCTLTDIIPGPDGEPVHAGVQYKGQTMFMLSPEGAYGGTAKAPVHMNGPMPFNLYLYMDDVDAAFEQAVAAGADAVAAPEDMFWGDRMGRVTDPSGFTWSLATKVGAFDPSKMPSA